MRDFHLPGRSAVFATNGMVATSHPLAAATAIDILKAGGNAADAAIAAAVLLGICEPQMTGIGGDMFALIQKDPNSDVVALNGSGRAPLAANAAALRDAGHSTIPLRSVDTVTIPGAIDGFCTLAKDFGYPALKRQFGTRHSLCPCRGASCSKSCVRLGTKHAGAANICARKISNRWCRTETWDNSLPRPGQATVLERVAAEGRDGFYTGAVAEDMQASLRAAGGCHTLEDFAATKSTYGTPLRASYKGVEMLEHPANGQGATALLMLNMMKHFDMASMAPFGTERAHIEAEISKLAYDARNRFIADGDYASRVDHMMAPETAAQLVGLIHPKRAMADPHGLSEAIHKDTIYITVVDKNRMAVSLIYSIFHAFGSGIASNKFGILFQNRGAGFSLEAGHPNELAGGKRPMHTIIPGMLAEGGRITMPFGVMGGSYQSNGHARFLSNMVDFGLDPQEAIDAPRCFSDAGTMKVERGYGPQVAQDLSDMGHKVEIPAGPIGGAQAILIGADGVLQGASDPRKDGCALGY
jgi:gamma-glutamyltranspeptidase/glutathione hydrolase